MEGSIQPERPTVLYALIRRGADGGGHQFLVRRTHGSFTFPPTRMREGQDLYDALDRILEGDLGVTRRHYYPECEFPVIERAEDSPAYEGLSGTWYLYPAAVSLTPEALAALRAPASDLAWMTLEEVTAATEEPNTRAIAAFLRGDGAARLAKVSVVPSMDALACHWARFHGEGVRIVTGQSIRHVLAAGERAFNLRVADPYLPYHRQGLGFTWSFFTPKDRQDLHVHGLPAVEIYGVIEGRLQLWWKPMNQRGVQVWKHRTLGPGDWAEVEPLHCHFAAWLTPEGLGTVIKAAGSGELAGVGRLGVSGKTTCDWSDPEDDERTKRSKRCSNHSHCAIPPALDALMREYAKPCRDRDYRRIAEGCGLAQSELRRVVTPSQGRGGRGDAEG